MIVPSNVSISCQIVKSEDDRNQVFEQYDSFIEKIKRILIKLAE